MTIKREPENDITRPVHASYDCKPGDVLITRKHKKPELEVNKPHLCKAPGISRDHPTSLELYLCTLPYECRCLVIRPNGCGWVYVLAEGRLGWISHTDLDRLEKQP